MRYFIKPAAVVYVAFCLFSPGRLSEAAEFELRPRIVVSEEYTDNVNESDTVRRKEYITRAMPGFSLSYKAPQLDLNSSYNFDYRHYTKGTKGDEYTHNLAASGTVTAVDNFFFIQVNDTYKRVSLDVTRDNTNESLYLNQSDQNIGSISPYFVWRIGSNSSLKTGYRYTNTWYKEPSGVDKREHYAFADASHELIQKFYLTWGYSYSDTDASDQKYQRHNAYGGFRYEYADKSFLFGQAGNTWQSFDNRTQVSNIFWNVGLTHDSPIAVATLETRVQYTEDPLRSSIKETLYSGKLSRQFSRGSMDVTGAYSEFEITETGKLDQKKTSFGASGKYELVQDLISSLSATGERFREQSPIYPPYRISANAGLAYSFNKDLSLSLSYTHVTYRNSLSDSAGQKEINRAVVELSKVF